MRIESSIVTSLSELRAIEPQRIADEGAALERERLAEIEAKRAVERARIAAKQARLRAEREDGCGSKRRAAAEIAEANRQRAALRRAHEEAQRKRDEAGRKGGFHLDVTCLHDAIGCIDGKPKKKT